MDIRLTDPARKEFRQFSEGQRGEIRSKIREVTKSFDHEDLKIVPNPFLDHSVWQVNIENTEKNLRAYLDVDQTTVIVLAIWEFEFTHSGEKHWRELRERMG